jgi:peptidoglycan hydrolase CwlO-like protein
MKKTIISILLVFALASCQDKPNQSCNAQTLSNELKQIEAQNTIQQNHINTINLDIEYLQYLKTKPNANVQAIDTTINAWKRDVATLQSTINSRLGKYTQKQKECVKSL